MATSPIGFSAVNCIISVSDMTVTEYPKKKDGEIKVYDLNKVSKSFEDTDGISFSISGKYEIPPDIEN